MARAALCAACAYLVSVVGGGTASAGSHTWRIGELYSNADGSVQFIELVESCGGSGEIFLSGHQVTSDAEAVNLSNLPAGSSANKRILLGTANLGSLGGPVPDYIIPANFFSLSGDTVRYTPYHTCAIGGGSVPTDGINSLHRPAGCAGSTCLTTVAANSPTNFAGDTGMIAPPVPAGTTVGSLAVALTLLLAGALAAPGRRRAA